MMSNTCPNCNADLSRSSGVACPNCNYVVKSDVANQPVTDVRKSRRDNRLLVLCIVVPFLCIPFFVKLNWGPLIAMTVCGLMLGGLFLSCWWLATRVTKNKRGQAAAGVLFFLGGIVVVIGLLVGGCLFLARGL